MQTTDALLQDVGAWLKKKFKVQSLILFGSRARGNFDDASDVDLLGIRAAGGNKRFSWDFNGVLLDVQIIGRKEALKSDLHPELMRISDAQIIFDKTGQAKKFLRRLDLHRKKLASLHDLDKHSRRLNLLKNLGRISRNDDASLVQRARVIADLLEDYRALSDRAPGSAIGADMELMRQRDPEFYAIYRDLLQTIKNGDALLMKAVSVLFRENG